MDVSHERVDEGPCPQRTILTSENFLETFGETIAELASGRWTNTLSPAELSGFSKSENGDEVTKGIVICDCPLLDIAGADIELSNDSAVIVQHLSSWSGDKGDQNGNHGGNTSSMQQGARTFITFIFCLVQLAGSGRYSSIHVSQCRYFPCTLLTLI